MSFIKKQVAETYKKIFGTNNKPTLVTSPGRVNIIGEHTDYNAGFVLPAAIDKAAYLAIGLRDDDEVHLIAKDLNESYNTTVKEIQPLKHQGWPAYILGSVAQFAKKGFDLKGFNVVLSSDVPIGAGLSSSAAVECAVVLAMNELLQTNLGRMEMLKMAQKAEHEYAGVMCGIMDQFASMMGKQNNVMKLDCRSLEFEYVPFDPAGYKILLLNTNVKHSLASSAYNTRRMECEQAVQWIKQYEPQVDSLREADMAMLEKYVLPKSELIYRRSSFVVRENKRLLSACAHLQSGNIAAMGKEMFAAHEDISTNYEVSCKELDWLVSYVKPNACVAGARMMGGGFGGCTINIIKEDAIEELLQNILPTYQSAMNLELSYYIASIGDGTRII